jgi:hypothetical protein
MQSLFFSLLLPRQECVSALFGLCGLRDSFSCSRVVHEQPISRLSHFWLKNVVGKKKTKTWNH